MRRIVFRADGNAQIGAGHIMRCLSLGMAARQLGMECIYIMADASFKKTVEDYGFSCKILNSNYTKMDQEIDQTVQYIRMFTPEVMVVDSYFISKSYLDQLHHWTKLVYIDDIKSFPYPVDYLINYNAGSASWNYADFYKKNKIKKPQLLLGEYYIPLREEFQNMKYTPVKKVVTDILFSAGGADPERVALEFANKICCSEKTKQYRFHLVLGSFEPDTEELKQLERQYSEICIHQNVTNMAKLMRECDLAVSAAGTTLYELCACGIPTITYILADNQILGAESLCEKEIMKNAGDIRKREDFWNGLSEMILKLCEDHEERQRMRVNAMKSVDGKGAEHIIETVLAEKLED